MKYTMGLDLGQSSDYTALCVLEEQPKEQPKEQQPETPPTEEPDSSPPEEKKEPMRYQCRHLQRFPLGTKYPAIVEAVQAMLATPQLKGNCELVVDASGVGRPVVDMFTAAELQPTPVTITGGTQPICDDSGMWKVPKRILVSTVQVLLQSQRIEFANVPDRSTLIKELLAFQVSITEAANDTYGGRTGTHDDLVLAVALAAWKAEYNQKITEFFFV